MRILFFFVFLSSVAFGQKQILKKIEKNIESKNFNKAFNNIQKLTKNKKEEILHDYCISELFMNNSNPNYSLDSSYVYLLKCWRKFIKNDIEQFDYDEQKRLCEKHNICLNKIPFKINSIAWKMFYAIKAEKNITKLLSFKEKLDFDRVDVKKAVDEEIELLEYKKVSESSNIIDYRKYLAKYPFTKYKDYLFFRIETLSYKKINTLEDCYLFLKEFPKSKNKVEILQKIEEFTFNEIINSKSIDNCYDFIIKYPNSKFKYKINEHLESLRHLDVLSKTNISNIELFINEFPNSKHNNSLNIKLDSLLFNQASKSTDIYLIDKYIKRNTNSSSVNLLKQKNDSLIKILAQNTKSYEVLKKLTLDFPHTKHFLFLKNKLRDLREEYLSTDFESLNLKIIPGYEEGSLNLEINKISFLDSNLNSKFKFKGYYRDHLCLTPNIFKALPNNWYYFNNTLFKTHSGRVKAISIENSNIWEYKRRYLHSGSGYDYYDTHNPPSIFARSYFFSDSIIISPNGYFINLFTNTYITNSIKSKKPLKAFNGINFGFLESLYGNKNYMKNDKGNIVFGNYEYEINQYNKYNDYPFVANDSLVIFSESVGELSRYQKNPILSKFPINKKIEGNLSLSELFKNDSDKWNDYYEICYFFNKYNLTSFNNYYNDIPENLKQASDNFKTTKECDIIIVYNYIKDKVIAFLDRNVLSMNITQMNIDNTGQLLIVESTSDNGRFDQQAILIFDIIDNRQLISIPGKFMDISSENKLILNANYGGEPYRGISFFEFDELDLNELINNKSKFIAKTIDKGFNLNDFTSNEDFEKKINSYQKFYDIKNNYLITLNSTKKKKIVKEKSFKNLINDYNLYFNEFQDFYKKNLSSLKEKNNVVFSLEHSSYDLNRNLWSLKTKTQFENSTEFYWIGNIDKILFEDQNSMQIKPSTMLRNNHYIISIKVEPDFAKQNLHNCKIEISSNYDTVIDLYSLDKYDGYWKLINYSAFAMYQSKPNIHHLFLPLQRGIRSYNGNYYRSFKKPGVKLPPGCKKIPDISFEMVSIESKKPFFANSTFFNKSGNKTFKTNTSYTLQLGNHKFQHIK